MIRGLVLGVLENGEPFTTAHVDRFIETYRNEAREIRRGLRKRIELDKVAKLVALEERIDFWTAIRKGEPPPKE